MADQAISPMLAALTSALSAPPDASVTAPMPAGPQTQATEPAQGADPVGQMTPMSQVVNPNPAQPQQAQPQGPPVPRPVLFDLMRTVKPESRPPQVGAFGALGPERSGSRLEHFEQFLGNFLTAFSSGMGAAHGPGAFGKGMAVAAAAPYERAVQQFQLGQQQQLAQAQVRNLQSETALREQQSRLMGTSVPLTLPNGQQIFVPASQLGQYLKGGYAANVGAASREKVADINAASKLNAIQLQTQITAGKASKFIPDIDQKGQPFYHVFNPFGQEIGQADVNAISSLMGRTSSTVEYKTDEQNHIVALPKTTTTSPNLPAGLAQKVPRLAAAGGGTPQARVVAAPGGGPLTAQRTGQSRSRADAASAILPLIQEARQQLQDPEVQAGMGVLAGRWSDLQRKAGNLPPKLRQLAGTLTSIYSLAGTMHGWRALQVASEFQKTYGGLEANPASLLGGLQAMESTAHSVYQAGYGATGGASGSGLSKAAQNFISKYSH